MRRAAAAALTLLVAASFGACATTTRTTFPPLGSSPAPPGDATGETVRELTAALAAVGLQAVQADRPFRPPEGPLLAAAPRTLVMVPLPQDPDPALIVVYALATPAAAEQAAKDHWIYIRSGPGSIQFAPGTLFELRIVGSTVVFFSWLPGSSPDDRTGTIAQTLDAFGTGLEPAG